MFKVESKIEVNSTPEKIFEIYKDVDNWKEWDISLDFSSIDGEFKSGIRGKLKPKKSPVVANVEFVEVIENRFFHVHNISILCIFDFYHTIEEKNNLVEITHIVEIKNRFKFLSLLSSFVGRKIGEDIQNSMETVLNNIKKLAEVKI